MKTNQQVDPVIANDFLSVRFDINDGGAPLTLDMTKIHPDVIRRAACVGFAQVRIVDAAAIGAADKSGAIIPTAERLAMKRARMADLIAHYETGTAEWSRVKTGGDTGGYLFSALCRMFAATKTPAEIRTYLDGLSEKEQTALREDDTVEPVIRAIKAERSVGQPKADTKTLLAGLNTPAV